MANQVSIDGKITHQQLTLGVHATHSHTSDVQLETIKTRLTDVADTANAGPGAAISASGMIKKLRGMNSDHANDQKKLAQLLYNWKLDSWLVSLGHGAISEYSQSEAELFAQSVLSSVVDQCGGQLGWDALPKHEKNKRYTEMYEARVLELGRSTYMSLPEGDRREIDAFVWLGCAMHKDLNCVKGGCETFKTIWSTLGVPGPALLPNKSNATTLQLLEPEEPGSSPAEEAATAASSGGAVRLAALAGLCFNHKDDETGHQDLYRDYFATHHGKVQHFPDTSNTRYGSYVDAATVLLIFRVEHIQFLEHVRDKKESGTLNNMESNILNGLRDWPTITELAVLAMYGQAISRPYMRVVRAAQADGKNGLELGTLQRGVLTHLDKLILDPDLLLGQNPKAAKAAVDGSEWIESRVFTAIANNSTNLPHLRDVLVEFLKAARVTWERFISEFAEGGQVESLTPHEMILAFMPPTNDANEGILGTWRVWHRRFPRLTQDRFNAIVMVRRNGTEDWMEQNLTDKDDAFLRCEARRIGRTGREAKRRADLQREEAKTAEDNRNTRAMREKKRQEKETRAEGIELILDEAEIRQLAVAGLDEQLLKHRVLGKDPRFSAKRTQPRFEKPLSSMKKADKVKVVLELAQNHVNDNASA
jgi:hypothetical protein